MYKSSDTETYSSGIRRIYEECTENNVKVEFREEKIGFTIIFYRKNHENVGINVGINSTQKKILDLIIQDRNITQEQIAKELKKSVRTIERNINRLKEKNIITRVGANKTGYWDVKLDKTKN